MSGRGRMVWWCWLLRNVAYRSYSSYILARTITVTYPTSPTVGTLQMQYTDDKCNITVTYIRSVTVLRGCTGHNHSPKCSTPGGHVLLSREKVSGS